MANNIHFLGDNAILNSDEDLFNFKYYAEKVQKLIQHNSNNNNPLTIGIYGKWGEGKTSFLNLIENQIDLFKKKDEDRGLLKYYFNPWRYSSEQEMLFDFFDGLSKTMFLENDVNLKKVGQRLIKFSKYLKTIKISASVGIPKFFGTQVSFEPSEIFKSLGEDFEGEELTIDKLKDKVNEALAIANYKIVVFIDDLDRLDKEEIYTILKLIKLNANFDNFIYIIALDSDQVAKAISKRYGNNKRDGRLFLEKIINLPIHVPKIEEENLQYFFEIKLGQIKDVLVFSNKEKKENEFKEIILEFSNSYFNNPREVLRVLNSFFIGAFAIGEDVHLRDLFWIEYLKIKDESCYRRIKNYSIDKNKLLSRENDFVDFNNELTSKNMVNGTREHLTDEYPESIEIINKLFPVLKELMRSVIKDTWRIELRVNCREHYEKYFSYHIHNKVPTIKIYQIEESIRNGDSDKLRTQIIDLYESKIGKLKVYFKIENLVKTITKENNRDFFYEFIFDNLDLIPDSGKDIFGANNKTRAIELIGSMLDRDFESSIIEDENQELVLKLAEKLDINELCHFTRKFKDGRPYKANLEKLISTKATDLIKQKPFFLEPTKASNKMIMSIWKKYKPTEFQEFINNNLIDLESVKLLVSNFPAYWNNSYFGELDSNNYNYMKELVDVDFVYKKISEINPELIKRIKPKEYKFPGGDASSIDENLEQFIYWYKIENDSKYDIR